MEEEVIGKIRAVLISNKGKSDLREMQKDYKMLMGEDIPYKKLGYTSLENFVKNAQSLKVSQGPNGVIFIEAAVTNSSKHMVQLINKQKSSKKKSGGSGRLPARYQSSRASGYIPRFQNQPKSRNQSNQQWRAQYLDSARPKSHVHQIVVSVDGSSSSSSGAQQRLVKSIALSQSSQTHTNQPTDLSSRKQPLKVTKSLTNPQISLINNIITNDSRPRMRSHNNFTQVPQSQSNIGFAPRHAAPTLSVTAIQALLEKHENPKQNRNPQLMKGKSVPDIETKKTNTNTSTKTIPNTNTNANKNSNDTFLNVDKMGPLKKLEEFTRTHGLSDPVVKTMHIPKAGRPYICSIKIDSETFSSYPRDCSTPDEAETEAVNNAFTTLLKRFSIHERSLLISTENDVLTRIPPIIECHFSGVWAEQIASDYRDKYSEQLPPNWLALLDTLPTISVEPALNNRYVLKMCKHGEKNAQRLHATQTSLQLSSDVSVPSNKLLLVPDGWLVEITFIASTIEVWCRRVDTDEANSYCDMAKDLQAYYNGASGKERATNVAPGGFYVVAFDGCWSRVRVLNTGEHDVTCFFIDYGDEHVVPKSDMYILKREFAREQAQAFVCRLSGLEELANMSVASNRLEQLAGQTYLAKPQMTDDTPGVDLGPSAISITLYDVNLQNDEIGDNVNLRLISEITADAVPTLNPLNINHVYVTHTTNKGDIYVQCHSEAFNKLNELIAALDTIDLDAEFSGVNIPLKGSPEATAENDAKTLYLARWTQEGGDGNLYRAKITDRSPCGQYICLYFIDFGNSQIIPITDTSHVYKLDKISDVLCAFPPLATRVMLDLDQENVTGFAKRVMDLLPTDKPVLLKIVRTSKDPDGITVPICEIFRRSESHNELFSVNASLKYIDTNLDTEDTNNNDKTTQLVKKLERLKSVSEQMDNNKPVPSTGILTTPYLPEPSEFFDVRIPFAVNPWNFFVQPYAMATQLKDLMRQLQQRYNGIRTDQLQLEDVIPGKIYASKYNDGKWYRTSVIKVINSGSISVFYCDFGYYANLTVKQLVPLDTAFLELPYQAIKARLAGIQPRDAKWSMDDCKYFEKLVHEKTFVSIVVAVQQDELYQCDSVLTLRLIDTSTDNDIYIDKLLVNEGIAASLETK